MQSSFLWCLNQYVNLSIASFNFSSVKRLSLTARTAPDSQVPQWRPFAEHSLIAWQTGSQAVRQSVNHSRPT